MEKNYLLVYPYDKWVGNTIPEFDENQQFQPSVCELRDGETTKPKLLTEADLVSLMDKNGIGLLILTHLLSKVFCSLFSAGTDATIAQHIQTIVDREYVIEQFEGATKYLAPSTLGIGLIEGYSKIGLENGLSKPKLRREVIVSTALLPPNSS